MSVEIKVPNFPESVADGTIVKWNRQPGEAVTQDETLVEIETDKVVFEVPAPSNGVLEKIAEGEGQVVVSGQVIGRIDEKEGAGTAESAAGKQAESESTAAGTGADSQEAESEAPPVSPSARRLIDQHDLDVAKIEGSGRGNRILKEDVENFLQRQSTGSAAKAKASSDEPSREKAKSESPPASEIESRPTAGAREEKRVPMTRLRARVAERLLEAQQNAAILTTFNEIDMQPVSELRQRYKDAFEKQHDTKLGFMSFFVKAVIEALRRFPVINASIDDNDIVYHGYFDIGIAVGSPRGLVVPILRDADQMGMADIESRIRDYGKRAQEGALEIDEITGGTFTITNGGVFGSMLSTPIINPPQSAILGMHKIQERPVAVNGQVVIRPMMYVALSYDHRLIDGREAVQFLVAVKEIIEDPTRLLLDV